MLGGGQLRDGEAMVSAMLVHSAQPPLQPRAEPAAEREEEAKTSPAKRRLSQSKRTISFVEEPDGEEGEGEDGHGEERPIQMLNRGMKRFESFKDIGGEDIVQSVHKQVQV